MYREEGAGCTGRREQGVQGGGATLGDEYSSCILFTYMDSHIPGYL